MKVGVPTEVFAGERRVAPTPDTVKRLIKQGFEVLIQAGAGEAARYRDADYLNAGAQIYETAREIWADADILIKVRPPGPRPDGGHEVDLARRDQLIICNYFPAQNAELTDRLSLTGCSLLALDQIPRISRAQKMDVLSSMANIAGYRAVIEAANEFGSFFAGQITAAGKTRPAQVLVIGAGVAGLAAIAAARGLGAEVRAFDVRPAVKEQCESLGARFLLLDFPNEGGETAGGYAKVMSKEFIDAEMALFAAQAKEVDIIITTALIPGKRAPILITEEMVASMRPGSVIVDLAAEQGGNCACTIPDTANVAHGVKVLGYTDLTSRLATHASQFFGTNICHLLDDMGGSTHHINLEDEVVRKSLILHRGELVWPPPPDPPAPAVAQSPTPKPVITEKPIAAASKASPAKPSGHGHGAPKGGKPIPPAVMAAAGALLLVVGLLAPPDFVQHFTVFVLACFIGWQVVWSVTPALHTPLMSVTNAISGIIVVGGILQVAMSSSVLAAILGSVAIFVATINIAGGFLVTRRMLAMFRREG